jgi:Uma2 family endonuclease
MAVTPERMSLAEFLKLPEVKPALELRQGTVSQKVPPSGPHITTQFWFGYQVTLFAEPLELARAFPEARLLLGEETYVPDLVVYRWERIPEDEGGDVPLHFTTLPDLAVEIRSPGQTVRSQLDRCREYIVHGVPVVVFADPERRTVHVLRASGEVGPLRDSDPIDITDVLPGFELTVSDLFSRIRARPTRRRS